MIDIQKYCFCFVLQTKGDKSSSSAWQKHPLTSCSIEAATSLRYDHINIVSINFHGNLVMPNLSPFQITSFAPIHRTEDHYIISTSGHRFLDATAGGTAYAVIGYNNDSVNSAISRQLKLYNHVDYKSFEDPLREELAALLCSSNPLELDRVMLSGGSGGGGL